MAFKLAEAYVEFNQKGATAVRSGVDRIKGSFAGASKSINLMTVGLTALGTGAAFRGLMGFVNAAAEAEKQTAKLEAVLKSTAGVSGQTVGSLEAHAAALQKVTAFEDDTIKGAQAVLLTFRKIGGETFPQATEAALDLATIFEGDLRGSALMLGKALEDPIRGITALRRAGVSFTKDQQEVIKSLVETGRVAEAQAAILKEIQGQVGGAARKVGDTTFGKLEQFKNAMGDLAEQLGGLLTPAVVASVEALESWTMALGGRTEAQKAALAELGKVHAQAMQVTSKNQADALQFKYRDARLAVLAAGGSIPVGFMGSEAYRRRVAALPQFSEQELAEKARAESITNRQRYLTSEKRIQADLRGADFERSMKAWESLRATDFGALRRNASNEAHQEQLMMQQEQHLRDIKEELVRQRYKEAEERWDATARYE